MPHARGDQVPSLPTDAPSSEAPLGPTSPPVAASPAARLVGRLAGWRRSLRVAVVLELTLLYSVTFVPLYSWLGMANSLLSIAPVAAAGGLLGLAAGLRAALGITMLSVGLYGFVGH